MRAARSDDEGAIRRLEAATWSPRWAPGPSPDPEAEFLSRFGPENVIVAVDGEALVGYLILGPWTDLESARHVLLINGLAVDPERQGEGVGATLLASGIERARRAGARRVRLRVLSTNEGARRLYERHGFKIEGILRQSFLLDGTYVDDVLMALDLTR